MSLEGVGYIISLVSDAMKKDISESSERPRVSAVSVDRATPRITQGDRCYVFEFVTQEN